MTILTTFWKYPKFICKIRKQVQLCVFPCNVALHQVQISDFGTLSLILVSFYLLSNLSPVFARTSQWKPNTSVEFTENSFRQVNSIDKGKELWKVESCLLSNTKDKIYQIFLQLSFPLNAFIFSSIHVHLKNIWGIHYTGWFIHWHPIPPKKLVWKT